MDLTNSKFGDKYITREGKIAIVIGGHTNIRKPFFDIVIGDPNIPFSEQWTTRTSCYADGIAPDYQYDLIAKL